MVVEVDGMESVTVARDIEYRTTESGPLSIDLYSPPSSAPGARRPAVLFVFGFPGSMFGGGFKQMAGYVSWARLVAASGMVGVTYTYVDPVADLRALLAHLRASAESLGIDETRLGLWAGSGNVPTALSLLMDEGGDAFRCAALCYGYMLDAGGSTEVADAAARFGFANPSAGRRVADLPRSLPLFVARAGRDQTPHVNQSIDAFVAGALAHNLPVTLVNHAAGPHSFDLFDDSEASRDTVRRILSFLRFHLVGAAAP